MVIQRWQSVLLFIATLLVGALLVFPIGEMADGMNPESSTPMYAIDVLPMFILTCLIFVLLLVDIFLYKNLRLQKQVALVSVVLMVVAAVIGGLHGSTTSIIAMVFAATMTVGAYLRMKADERLLKSYDRIR